MKQFFSILATVIFLISNSNLGYSTESDGSVSEFLIVVNTQNTNAKRVSVTLTTSGGEQLSPNLTDEFGSSVTYSIGTSDLYSILIEIDGFAQYRDVLNLANNSGTINYFYEVHCNSLKNTYGDLVGQNFTAFSNVKSELFQMEKGYMTDENKDLSTSITRKYVSSNHVYTHSETKFYMTTDGVRELMKKDHSFRLDFNEHTAVKYLTQKNSDMFNYRSYHNLYTGKGNADYTASVSQKATKNVSSNCPFVDPLNFTVQLGTFSKAISPKRTDANLISFRNSKGTYVLCSGKFSDYETARAHKAQLAEEGRNGVFVTAYSKGERISMQQAKEMMQ